MDDTITAPLLYNFYAYRLDGVKMHLLTMEVREAMITAKSISDDNPVIGFQVVAIRSINLILRKFDDPI